MAPPTPPAPHPLLRPDLHRKPNITATLVRAPAAGPRRRAMPRSWLATIRFRPRTRILTRATSGGLASKIAAGESARGDAGDGEDALGTLCGDIRVWFYMSSLCAALH